ncbi:MAG: amidase [Anaerolineales bacterium]|nr:amidase [Anaerolineales bacterium]
MPPKKDDPMFAHHSLTQLAAELRNGRLSLLTHLDQLEAYFNQREPDVLAFVPEENRFARLRRDAQALLSQYPDPAARPPLFGIPIGVKDIFHTDGFVTQAGSRVPASAIQGQEATSVTQLKAAGALILGKTVTTEFAYFAPGPTRNPYNLAHTPGGSSSGSAAAVGAGVCPLALGTQTIGSISRPAAFCGVVGYKPSYDRISRAGVIPLSPSLDHVGVFAPDVGGATLAAAQLCPDWQATTPTRQPVLGVPAGPYLLRADAAALAQFERVCGHLADTGWQVKRVEAMPDFAEIVARHNLLVAADAAAVHAAWFAQFADRYHAKTAELIGHGQAVSTEAIAAARQGRMTLRHGLVDLMRSAGVDLWLSPSAPGTAPRGLESTGDPVMNLPWTHAGLPTVSVPSGFAENGLPWGLQIAGNWYTDEYLLAWAEPIAAALAQMERN